MCLFLHSSLTDHGHGDELHHRARLDRRRLQAGHMKYAILMTQQQYPETSQCQVGSDIVSTLEEFTPLFYNAFALRFSGIYFTILNLPNAIEKTLVAFITQIIFTYYMYIVPCDQLCILIIQLMYASFLGVAMFLCLMAI